MADTSLQVHTWITKALHTDVWVRATQNVDDAITKCSQFPIESAEGAKARRAQWETLVKVIETTETTVKPLRSRIHDIRTELALRVNAVLDPAKDRASDVQRMLGAWDAQERVRVAALEAERRKIAATENAIIAAAKAESKAAVIDALSTRGLAHQGSVFDADSPEAPEVALVDTIDPFTTRPVPAVQAATAGPTGPTKKTWVVEILDADKLVAALIALPSGDMLQTALRVHEPTLRRLLANGLGPDKVVAANLDTLVSVRCEDRAVRSRKATP